MTSTLGQRKFICRINFQKWDCRIERTMRFVSYCQIILHDCRTSLYSPPVMHKEACSPEPCQQCVVSKCLDFYELDRHKMISCFKKTLNCSCAPAPSDKVVFLVSCGGGHNPVLSRVLMVSQGGGRGHSSL